MCQIFGLPMISKASGVGDSCLVWGAASSCLVWGAASKESAQTLLI